MPRPKTLRPQIAEALGVSPPQVTALAKKGLFTVPLEKELHTKGALDPDKVSKHLARCKAAHDAHVERNGKRSTPALDPTAPQPDGSTPPPEPHPNLTTTEVSAETLQGLNYYVTTSDKHLKEHESYINYHRGEARRLTDEGGDQDAISYHENKAILYGRQQNDLSKNLTAVLKELDTIERAQGQSHPHEEVLATLRLLAKKVSTGLDQLELRLMKHIPAAQKKSFRTHLQTELKHIKTDLRDIKLTQ